MAVVISDNLVLSPTSGTKPLTHARIGYQKLAGTITASSEAAGFPKEAADNSLTYSFWQPATMPASWEIDIGSGESATYIGIAAHTMGDEKTEVFAEYWDGSAWVQIDSMIPANNSPIMFIFEKITATKFRVRLVGSGAPFVGVIYIGEALEMYRPMYGGHNPLSMSGRTVVRPVKSERGQWLGRSIIRSGSSTSYQWENNPALWVRENWKPFIEHAKTSPFFIAWRPETFPQEVGYCWTPGDVPAPTNQGVRDFMSLSLDVEGLGNE